MKFFYRYQKDKNLSALQLELSKFIINYKRDKKRCPVNVNVNANVIVKSNRMKDK